MINPTYPGVYVREESSGARAVAGVATSITAFVGMTQRMGLTGRDNLGVMARTLTYQALIHPER